MRHDRRARAARLLAAAVLAIALLVAVVALPSFVGALAALIVVFLPSYLIMWPVLQPRLGSAGAFTIAGGLSIGMVAIGGLVLNLLPWGLQAATWLAYVAAVLAIALAFALALGLRPPSWRPRLGVAPHELALGGIGAIMLMGALILARSFAAYPTESFTQLWIAPAAGAPTPSVEVSIRNEEQAPTTYRLEVRRNGARVESWADISLATGETWSRTVSVGSGQIEARLFRLSEPGTLYRHVEVQVGGTAQSAARQGG